MKIKGKILKDEYVHFQRLANKQPFYDVGLVIYTIYSSIALIYCLYRIIFVYSFDIESIHIYIAIIFVLSFYSVYQYFILPKKWEKEYENNKGIHIPMEIELTENELTIKNELLNYQQPWNHYASWMEDNKVILLFEKNDRVIFIPKRILNEEEMNSVYSKIKENNILIRKPKLTPQFNLIFLMIMLTLLTAYIIYSIFISIEAQHGYAADLQGAWRELLIQPVILG